MTEPAQTEAQRRGPAAEPAPPFAAATGARQQGPRGGPVTARDWAMFTVTGW